MVLHSRLREIQQIEATLPFRFTQPSDDGRRNTLDGNRAFAAVRGVRLIGQ